jgi:hypothetical protein
MKKRSCRLLLLLALLMAFTELAAQIPESISRREHPTEFRKNKRYFAVGGFVGSLHYFGDLAPKNKVGSTHFASAGPGIGFSGMYRFSPHAILRSNFMWGRLQGDDISADIFDKDAKFRYVRNMHFRNDIKELSVEYVFDLLGQHRTFASRASWTPYLFAGIALFHHNPKARVPAMDALHYDLFNSQPIRQNDPRYGGVTAGDWIALKPLGTEGQYVAGSGISPYSNWQMAIPAGLGVRYRFNRHTDFAFEIGYRHTFTDYLDDVSGDYLNPDAFGTGPQANLARLMADRSKEPYGAVSEKPRELQYIQENIHSSSPYGQVPAEFGHSPYELTNGYGRAGNGNIRGKGDHDIFVVLKLQFIFMIGRGSYY